ncbi:hypothetical protein NCCP2145_29230 [Pseudarthrobacter sp. NCCP-2145]|nr:hypothetical protein NCCP2145_29230 [Pseudarthrobacter sp. NCCP-2145]
MLPTWAAISRTETAAYLSAVPPGSSLKPWLSMALGHRAARHPASGPPSYIDDGGPGGGPGGANLLLDSGNLVYRNHNLAAGVPLHV